MGVVFSRGKEVSSCLGVGKSYTTSLGASGTSYLICEYNYFPKKLKWLTQLT